jgi:hypothetical protein
MLTKQKNRIKHKIKPVNGARSMTDKEQWAVDDLEIGLPSSGEACVNYHADGKSRRAAFHPPAAQIFS